MGCGGGMPRIAFFAKLRPRIDNCVSPGQRLPYYVTLPDSLTPPWYLNN